MGRRPKNYVAPSYRFASQEDSTPVQTPTPTTEPQAKRPKGRPRKSKESSTPSKLEHDILPVHTFEKPIHQPTRDLNRSTTINVRKLGAFRHGELISKSNGMMRNMPLTSVSKSFQENIDMRLSYYKEVETSLKEYEKQVEELELELKGINKRQERIRYLDLEADIRDKKIELQEMQRKLNKNREEYMFAVADSIRPTEKTKLIRAQVQQRMKSAPKSTPTNKTQKKRKYDNMVEQYETASAADFFETDVGREKDDEEKVTILGTLLYEVHSDLWSAEFCPSCPYSPLYFNEQRAANICSQCKLTIPRLDLRTNSQNENKDSSQNNLYAVSSYFFQWVRRLMDNGKVNSADLKELVDDVYCELHRNKIFDVSMVTWCLVDEIFRNICKTQDANMAKYYNMVFSITQTIRGTPLLPLNIEDINEIRMVQRRIQNNWNTVLSKQFPHRQNFLSNPVILQLCLFRLNYPKEILAMFKPLKCAQNIQQYDQICKAICDLNHWKKRFDLISTINLKFGDQQTFDMFAEEQEEDQQS